MLSQKQIDVLETVDARKVKIDENQAWEMLKKCEKVMVGAGKTCYEFTPEEEKAALLKRAMGRSGSLRAPALLFNNQMLIGFNETMYETYL